MLTIPITSLKSKSLALRMEKPPPLLLYSSPRYLSESPEEDLSPAKSEQAITSSIKAEKKTKTRFLFDLILPSKNVTLY